MSYVEAVNIKLGNNLEIGLSEIVIGFVIKCLEAFMIIVYGN